MSDLRAGHARFKRDVWPRLRGRFQRLALMGQSPHTLVIACSDSRVDPQLIFSAEPGDLYVVRNVANIVPPYEADGGYHGTSAALELGVKILKVARIAVLGHARCGGAKALLEAPPRHAQDFLDPWLSIIDDVMWTPDGRLNDDRPPDYYERAIVRASLANLRTFPWVAERADQGRLSLEGYRFDMTTGDLERIDPEPRQAPV